MQYFFLFIQICIHGMLKIHNLSFCVVSFAPQKKLHGESPENTAFRTF